MSSHIAITRRPTMNVSTVLPTFILTFSLSRASLVICLGESSTTEFPPNLDCVPRTFPLLIVPTASIVRQAEKTSVWASINPASEQNYRGAVTYGECSMLTSILSRPGETRVIPEACRFDEANNMGRVHTSVQNTLYKVSRRLTKTMVPGPVVAELPQNSVHFNDHPQQGEINLKECHTLANHLHDTFGVTNLLPASCSAMLEKARGDSASHA